MMLFLFVAWTGHTDASRDLAIDIGAAMVSAGMKREEAAALMGITAPELSRQLAGVEPLNLWRLWSLPVAFKVWLFIRQAKRVGAEFLTPEHLAIVQGAAALGKKKMSKMFLVPQQPQQQKESA